MARGETCNDHHGVPRSSGGSDEHINISYVNKERHDQFHAWAHNRRPCLNTRLVALHSIGLDQGAMHPETIQTLFEITTMRDWYKLYYGDAFKNITKFSAPAASQEIFDALGNHITEERLCLQQTLGALTGRGSFPVKDHLILPRCLRFFNESTPARALQEMYTEDANRHGLAWVKPMQQQTRTHILFALKRDNSLRRPKDLTRQLQIVLKKQLDHILQHEEEWTGHKTGNFSHHQALRSNREENSGRRKRRS